MILLGHPCKIDEHAASSLLPLYQCSVSAGFPSRYHARIRVMNYHKELKTAGNVLFHADYRRMTAFQINHLV